MVDGSRSGFIPHTKLYITTTRFLKGFVKIFYLIFLEFNPDGMRNRVLVRTEGYQLLSLSVPLLSLPIFISAS